jgi:mRNA interferase MazF
MPTFEPGTVVKVPFPDVERPVERFRPALVVSSPELGEVHGLLWVLMITSARNEPWAGDIEISNPELAGLPAPSVVRCAKIATIEKSSATAIGSLASPEWKLVTRMLDRVLNGSRMADQ